MNAIFPSALLFQHMEKSLFKVTFCIFPLLFIFRSHSLSNLFFMLLLLLFVVCCDAVSILCVLLEYYYFSSLSVNIYTLQVCFIVLDVIFFLVLKVILTRETQQLDQATFNLSSFHFFLLPFSLRVLTTNSCWITSILYLCAHIDDDDDDDVFCVRF